MRKSFFILLLLLSSFVQAQNIYTDSLKQQLSHATDDTTKIQLLIDLSNYYTWSYADTSLLYAKEALRLAQVKNIRIGIGYAQRQICRALTTLGNYPVALDYGFKALSLFEKEENFMGIIEANADIALCYRELGDYNKGLKYIQNAIHLLQTRFPRQENLVFIFGVMSSIYEKNNQLDSAIKYAKIAYQTIKDWSGILYVLGSAYAKKGHFDSAMHYYKLALPIAEVSHAQIDILDVYNGIAGLYKTKGERDSVIQYATKAVQQQWARAYPLGLLQASTLLAEMYEGEKKYDSTTKYLKLSIALRDSLFNQERTRAVQNIAFSEQQKQQALAAAQQQYRNRIRMNALAGSLFTMLVIIFVLYRNNRNKQKAKIEIEKAYTALKSTQAQLIQSEKMASLGELTAGIAHEIQNPLNFVNNFSETNIELLDELQQELNKGNYNEAKAIAVDAKGNEQKIMHHGKRADSIVKGMLEHSRSSKGEKQATDINALADEYLRLSYHGLRAKDKSFNASLHTSFDQSIGKIAIVPQDIGRVLLNLFNNAFYAVNEKKQRIGESYEPIVDVRTKKGNSRIEMCIKDNGNGISKQAIDKIFQPFFTTKPTGQGTGLGLSLSYDIIIAHGGELKVESKEGEGVTFTVSLPSA